MKKGKRAAVGTKKVDTLGPEVQYLSENEGEDPGSHRSTHAGIKQRDDTIFKINAVDWNNVPNIVYEAVCTIVTKYDNNVVQAQKIKEDQNRELRNLRTLHDIMERGMEDNNEKLKTGIEALKKHFLDKLKHV
jgi:hypothetical protein